MITTCNICGNTTKQVIEIPYLEVLGVAPTWAQTISICSECGFVFNATPFSQVDLDRRYKYMSTKYERDDEVYALDGTDDYSKRSKRQVSFLESIIGGCYDSLIEVGASSGYNLSLYKQLGKNVYGIEPSDTNVKNAKRIYDVDMYSGTFDEYLADANRQSYDVMYLSMVLEHIVNPKTFIEQCDRLTNKYMFIEVPTLDYKFADEPYGMFTDEHVNYFTLPSLETMMNSCGYSLVDMDISFVMNETAPSGYPCIRSIWKKCEGTICSHKPVSSSQDMLQAYLAVSKEQMKHVVSTINNIPADAKVALWGIGNTVSKLLAMTDLRYKNIVKGYDSDLKKMQFTLLGCPIQPFNPEDLESGVVDTIVVTTYTAQKAILRALNSYKEKVNIVTLF